MSKLVLTILFMCSGVFAGACSFFIPRGMQEVTEDSFNGSDSSSFPSLENTINISGIVVDADVNIYITPECMRHGIPCCCYLSVYSSNGDSLNADKDTVGGKLVTLSDFKVSFEKETLMSRAANPNFVIYPSNLDLKAGDTLYINNYSALYYNVFSEGYKCDIDPQISVTGEYFVNSVAPPLSMRSHMLKVERPKIHNRDASGRCLSDKKRHIIEY